VAWQPEGRGIRWGFVAAWVLLVVVVAAGFFIQARTIDRLKRDEQAVSDLVTQTDARQTRNAETLCGLLVFIDPDDRPVIAKTFHDLGYNCSPP
jgi:hypothetical protein